MQKIKNFLFKNTNTKQTIAKNTFWLFFGEIIGRILKLGIVVFATRKLGVEGWGLFSYSLAYVGFFYFLGDFGINTFLTREMSKDNVNKHKYLSTIFIVKLILLLLYFITSLAIGPHFGNIRLGFGTILVFSIFSVSESIREFGMSINRSLEKMERECFSKILINTIILTLVIILISKNANPISLILAYTIGSILSTIYIFWSIRHELKIIDWKFSRESLKIIYSFSWPIMILGFFGLIGSLDSIMLGQMKSAVEVGLYAASQRLVGVSSIISGFIAVSIFPMLSKNESNNEKIGHIVEKIMVIIIAIAVPITIGGVIFGKEIIVLILGNRYLAAVPIFQILTISILACFPDLILNNVIFSKNLQRIFLKTTTLGLITTFVLNILLIPKYGAIGAAISTVIAQLLIMILNWRKLKKFISFNVLPKLKSILIANVIFILVIYVCKIIGINFIVSTIISFFTYGAILYYLKDSTFIEILSLLKNR